MPTNPTWEDTVEAPTWDDTADAPPGGGATRDFVTTSQVEKLQRQFLPTAISEDQWAGMSERAAREEQMRRGVSQGMEAGTGLTTALYQELPAAIGTAMHDAGTAIYEGGVNAIANRLPEFYDDPNEIAQQYDTETAIRSLPTGQRIFARAGEGLVKSTPQMAVALVNPYLGALAFGFTPEGFSVKHAALAAALPFIGTKSGALVEYIAARLGMSSEAALMAVNKIGGATGAAGAISVDEAYRISQLPEAEQGEAWFDATANIASQMVLGTLGPTQRLKNTDKVLTDRANAKAETMRAIERDFNRRNAGPADEGAAVPEWESTSLEPKVLSPESTTRATRPTTQDSVPAETLSPAAQEMPAPTMTAPSRAVETTQAASADAAGDVRAEAAAFAAQHSRAEYEQSPYTNIYDWDLARLEARDRGIPLKATFEVSDKYSNVLDEVAAMREQVAAEQFDIRSLATETQRAQSVPAETQKTTKAPKVVQKLPPSPPNSIPFARQSELATRPDADLIAIKPTKDGNDYFVKRYNSRKALETFLRTAGEWKAVIKTEVDKNMVVHPAFQVERPGVREAKPAASPVAAVAKVQEHVTDVASGAKPTAPKPQDSGLKTLPATGPRPAKEIKTELVQRLEELAADIPTPEFKESKVITRGGKREFNYSLGDVIIEVSEAAKTLDGWVARIYETSGKTGTRTSKIVGQLKAPVDISKAKEWAGGVLEKLAYPERAGTVTVEIPGDGTFTIEKTHYAINRTLERAQKLNTSSGGKGYTEPERPGFNMDKWAAEARGGVVAKPARLKPAKGTSAVGADSIIDPTSTRPIPKSRDGDPRGIGAITDEPGINTGNLGEAGMGGAKPTEFRHNPQSPTGIRNAVVDQERVKRGLPPAMEAARKDFGTTWDEAMARMDQDPEAAIRLVDQLQRQPRALSDVENALLLHRQIELQNEYGKLTRDLAQAFEDGQSFPNRLETMEELKARVAETSDKLQVLYDTGKAVGTEQGRGLASRKMLAFEDYSLAKMEMEKRAAKGGTPLSDAERAELGKLQERIAKTEQEFQAYREKQEAERANRMTDEAIREIQDELKRRPNYDPRIIQVAEEIVVKLEKQAVSAQERLKAKFARTNTGLDPTIIYDLGVVGAAKIARLGLDFGKFSAAMLADFGDGIQPYLQAAWERSNLHLENEGAKYGDKAPQVKNLLRKRDASGKRENVIEGLKKGVADGVPMELQGDYIRKLAESFVEGGITKREPLIDAVHDVLTKQLGLDMTRRETMDAISGYGKFKPLNTNAIKATLRDLRGQMQQVSKLEDIQARKPLQKTGVERRSPSDEERRLVQQVNEAKRRFGVVVNDPARQLKSALDAIKTRLKHQIADIEYQLNTKERIVKTKSPSPVDAETQLLELRRDGLRAQLDELLPKPGLTPEQQIARVMASLERSVADYERRIKGGDVAARERKTPLSSPALEALRARRDAVKAEWQELRELNETYQREQYAKGLERQKSALEESIKAKESQLAAGPSEPVGRAMNRPADPMLESLMQQRDALAAKIAEARRKPESVKYAEQMARKLETMQRQIAERQAKFDAGDFAANTRPTQQNRPLPPELEIAKQQLEAITAKIVEARNGPPLSPEAKALKSLKARLAQNTANYMDRLARRDFKKREHFEPRLDAEALRLKAANEIAKREFHRGLIMDRLANQSTGQKIYGGVKEMLNLPRNLLSSWDVSAVLRQGGFIGLGNPARAAAALGPMFRALASERAAVMVEQEILSRPNAPLYKQAKLYLAPHEALHLSAMEEQIMSRLAGKVPGLRASNRAYITFLNRLRADSFDALLESVARKDGSLNQPEMQAIANYVNVATGRGDLGRAAAAAETLATVFFSPRLVASRFQLLAGQPLYGGSARTRKAIAQEYGKFLAGIGVVYALGSLAGATIASDPRGSDFGKLRFGDTRVDVLGGLGQASVLLSRLGTGQTRTMDGELRSIRGDLPYGARTSQDVIADFLRSKLSPVAGAAVDMVQQKNVVGEPVTAKSVATNLTIPLSFRDIYDVMQDQGMTRGSILTILSLFGFGLQHHDVRQRNSTVDDMMKHVRGLTPEQRATVRAKLEETTK